jgi:hypothetical protein
MYVRKIFLPFLMFHTNKVTYLSAYALIKRLLLYVHDSYIAAVIIISAPNTRSFVSFRPYLFYLLTAGVEVVCFYFHLITFRHTPQSVGLLWTRDRTVAETST